MKLSSRRSRLRHATTEAHARLDALVARSGFFDDRGSYVAYLRATWRARVPVELALDANPAAAFAPWRGRRILSTLRRDLVDLTGSEPAAVSEAPECLLDSPARIMGALYVLEGSALGAVFLVRRATALGMSPGFGARHFATQTAPPADWSRFLSVLEATPLDPDQEKECAAAASATFLRFENAYGAAMPDRHVGEPSLPLR